MRKHAVLRKPAAAFTRCTADAEGSILGKLRATKAANKSYICFMDVATGKWKHLLTVRDPTPDHSELVDKLADYARSCPSATKEKMLELRDKWVTNVTAGKELDALGCPSPEGELG